MARLKAMMVFCVSLVLWAGVVSAATCPKTATFPVFDTFLYTNKPDTIADGLKEMTLMGVGWFADKLADNPDRLPTQSNLNHLMCIAGSPDGHIVDIVIDIEHWPLDAPESPAKYEHVLRAAKQADPSKSVGLWATAPRIIPWQSFLAGGHDANSPEQIAYRASNDAYQGVANLADALYPAAYTYQKDIEQWKRYAKIMIDEARRLGNGKPVYLFLSPQHPKNGPYLGEFVSGEMWRAELEFARNYADGVVIWGYYAQEMNPADPWYTETVNFIQSLGGGF